MARPPAIPYKDFPIIESRLKTETLHVLASEYGIGINHLQRYLQYFQTSYTKIQSAYHLSLILDLLAQGKHLHIIAKKLNRTTSSVYKILGINGYTPKGIKK